uniref:39S ribosomal protein L16, mitochondrial-like n=1 Tax=Styela clava TaxID=7725 RepID=UPI0019394B1C|nr:39S ribosomal protein L16, mitochondrial-like [Styela clava]
MFMLKTILLNKTSTSCHRILQPVCLTICLSAGKRWTAEDCIAPPTFDDVEVDSKRRGLPVLPKVPDINIVPQPKHNMRETRIIRGPCLGEEAELKHKQYGIIALKGGFLKHGHFEMMRLTLGRGIRKKPMFAEYRVPGVHKPITRHPTNAVMGGGKGKIDHYVTPVKARQVIVEIAGKGTFEEVYRCMRITAEKLPFPAIAVNYEQLNGMYEEEVRLEEENENFITFREIVEKNMQGMRSYLTKYDLKQFGKYK